jgi:hypothetical protein
MVGLAAPGLIAAGPAFAEAEYVLKLGSPSQNGK